MCPACMAATLIADRTTQADADKARPGPNPLAGVLRHLLHFASLFRLPIRSS
jgi:hypothetical protein